MIMRVGPWLLIAVFASLALQRTAASEDRAATRRLWDEAFRRKRVEAGQESERARTGEAYVGVTVWRLRPAAPSGAGPASAQITVAGSDWLAERVETGTRLAAGERLRLGIESARRGYLYVLDTEEYADGSRGEPHLVFPTTRTRGGDNRVAPGRLIEIPDLSDTPPYFSIQRSRKDHMADVLTILVTQRPLASVRPGRVPLAITREHLARWERTYGAPAARIELPDGAGRPYTAAERAAASSNTRLLAHDDPLPQTLIRIATPAEGGLLAHVSLGILEKETP
jgi:hypothetical protein